MDLLEKLRGQGDKIVDYGASGRANAMVQYCGINHTHLDCMIDDASAKAGHYTPKSHFEIHPSSILDGDNPPGYLFIFAWNFFDEIRKRNSTYLEKGDP